MDYELPNFPPKKKKKKICLTLIMNTLKKNL